ncbi:MAG: hypothetical protein ACOH5I_15320 [Oligoflexus sp.]
MAFYFRNKKTGNTSSTGEFDAEILDYLIYHQPFSQQMAEVLKDKIHLEQITCRCKDIDPPAYAIKKGTGSKHKVHLAYFNKKKSPHDKKCTLLGHEKETYIINRKRPKCISWNDKAPSKNCKKNSNTRLISGQNRTSSAINVQFKRLAHVVEHAGLNTFSEKSPKTLQEAHNNILGCLSNQKLGRRITVDQFTFFFPRNYKTADLVNSLPADNGSTKTAHFFIVVKSIDSVDHNDCIHATVLEDYGLDSWVFKKKIIIDKKHIKSNLRGPFLVYFSFMPEDYFSKAFAIQVVSENILLPVDSEYERKVAKKLIAFIESENKSRGRNLVLHKPIYLNEQEVIPDFELYDLGYSTEKPKVIIEVFGYDSAKYLEDKELKIEQYSKSGDDYIIFEARKADKKGLWERELNGLISRIKQQF